MLFINVDSSSLLARFVKQTLIENNVKYCRMGIKVCGHWWKLFNAINHNIALSMRQGIVSTMFAIDKIRSVRIDYIAIILRCDFNRLRRETKKSSKKINKVDQKS